MMTLFNMLSLYIVEITVPLIPTLYSLFEKLTTFEFLSNKYIQSVWNNIYVLVGVIVLFAIAIKLISTMVNPDTLTDNKKGVKGLYFRTVIAVVLIFIIPIIFSYSFTLQAKLVNSNFLISRVFGYKIADDKNVGELLGWTTFSSFCTLGEAANESDYVCRINGHNFLKKADRVNGEEVDNDILHYDSSEKAYYIVEILEAVSSSKLSRGENATNNYKHTRDWEEEGGDAVMQNIINEVGLVVGKGDNYSTLATKKYLKEMNIVYHDDSVYNYFQTNYPELFE